LIIFYIMCPSNLKDMFKNSITTAKQLAEYYPSMDIDLDAVGRVIKKYPMLINPYIAQQLRNPDNPFWKQAVPHIDEIDVNDGIIDPLAEEKFSPVVNITHRYPDRVLFLVSNQCAMYCRFCTRKRKIGKDFKVDAETINVGIEYIQRNEQITDVLVSGGDPFMLEDDSLADILSRLRAVSHVETIRIGTRVPILFPQRVTENLAKMLSRFQPLYINTHINHSDEITDEVRSACGFLSNAGISLGCQTVLLKGINDTPDIMKKLMKKLLQTRIRPYYLHHGDMTRGASHFRTTIKTGLDIVSSMRGNISGMCVPHYVIDLPGGGGKVPLLPEAVCGIEGDDLLIKNYQGKMFKYRVDEEDRKIFKINN